jgi:hypothetical protein
MNLNKRSDSKYHSLPFMTIEREYNMKISILTFMLNNICLIKTINKV